MSVWKAAMTMFRKDLDVELRTREIVSTTGVFALLVVVLCAFAFDLNTMPPEVAGPGALWIALCFSGMLAVGRSYLKEREMDVWTGLLLSPASRGGLYLGKMIGLVAFLGTVGLVLVPVVELLFHTQMLANIHLVLPVLFLGIVGFCALGALFGAMIVRTSVRDLLLGVVMFPLASPLLILAAKATAAAVSGDGADAVWGLLKFVAALDVIYIALGTWLFEPLMED